MSRLFKAVIAVVAAVILFPCNSAEAKGRRVGLVAPLLGYMRFAHGDRGPSVNVFKPPACFKEGGEPSPERLEQILLAKEDFFPRKVIFVQEEACKYAKINSGSKVHGLMQEHAIELIRRLRTPELDEPKYSLDDYGWESRKYYHLILCYSQKLRLTPEDLGATDAELRQVVKARTMETQPATQLKKLRKEALKWLAVFDKKSRDSIRPVALRGFRQNIANFEELVKGGGVFGITPQELGLWKGELQVIQELENKNPSWTWRASWWFWLKFMA